MEALVPGLFLRGYAVKVLVAANQDLAGSLESELTTAGVAVECVSEPGAAVSRLQAGEGPVLLDYELPGLGGTRGVQLARSLIGDRPLVVVYALAAPAVAHRALSAGADAVFADDLNAECLKAALTLLGHHRRFAIFDGAAHYVSFDAATALTDRELQVLHGVCDGLQNKEIAHRFGISEVTVKMHVRGVIRKLGARNRTHAAMLARDLEIV